MGTENRKHKRGKKAKARQPGKVARLKGDAMEGAVCQVYNTFLVGIEIIYDHAVRGDLQAIRAIVAIGELTLDLGGRCRGSAAPRPERFPNR